MDAEFLPGDRCLISHDIIIEGRPAFEVGEPVVVQDVRPNPQSPRHKYVVLSQKFQKLYQLQGSDLTSQATNSPEEQPYAPAEAMNQPSAAGTNSG